MSINKGLFIGAGFSYDFGLPLVGELTKTFKTWLPPEKLLSFYKSWLKQGSTMNQRAISILVNLLGQEKFSYEQIIGELEREKDLIENRDIRDDLHYLHVWCIDMVSMLLQEHHIKNAKYISTTIKLHKGINSLIEENHPLWIFSLNHDLVVEMIAGEFKIPLKNGFSDESIDLYFDEHKQKKASFKKLDMKTSSALPYNFFSSGEVGINLVKLHGSLDIFGFDDLKSYLAIVPLNVSAEGYIERLKFLYESYNTDIKQIATNEMIVLDDAGEIQFLRKSMLTGSFKFKSKHTQVMPLQVLDLFRLKLEEIDELVIIGYSFCDEHINRVLIDWLETSATKRTVIVNPYLAPPDFFKHFEGRVLMLNQTGIQYLSALPGGALSANELAFYTLRKKIREDMDEKTRKNFLDGLQTIIEKMKESKNNKEFV